MRVPEELTVTETAAYLGLSRCRILQLISDGRLPHRRVGPIFLLPAARVRAFGKLDRPAGNPKFAKKSRALKP